MKEEEMAVYCKRRKFSREEDSDAKKPALLISR